MLCTKCGSELEAGKAFCADCGEKQGGNLCTNCGVQLEEGKYFCPDCGERQGVKPMASQAARPQTQQRQYKPHRRGISKKAIIAIITAIAVIASGLGVYFVFFSGNNGIIGEWAYYVDFSEEYNNIVRQHEDLIGKNFNNELKLKFIYEFKANNTFTLAIDENYAQGVFNKWIDDFVSVAIATQTKSFNEMGVSYAEFDAMWKDQEGVSFEDYMRAIGENSLNSEAMFTANMFTGRYKIDGDTMFIAKNREEFRDSDYTVFELSGDTLTFISMVNTNWHSNSEIRFPLVLNRVVKGAGNNENTGNGENNAQPTNNQGKVIADIRDSIKRIGTYIKDEWSDMYALDIKDKDGRRKSISFNNKDNSIELGHWYNETEPPYYSEGVWIIIKEGAEIFEYASSVGEASWAEGTINPKTLEVKLTENGGIAEKWYSKAFIQDLLCEIDKILADNGLPYTHVDLGFAKID
jgi:predicted RNA-binding Zn-ribbon protein involved in translation (DUF1610 family)